MILDVSGPLVIADYFVIATARNPRHALALARELEFTAKQLGIPRRNTAGAQNETPWVLLDLDEIVVHIFQEQTRSFYDLEGLWADVPRVPLPVGVGGTSGRPDSTGTL